MKKTLLLLYFFMHTMGLLAQTENSRDSLAAPPLPEYKNIGGFLIDMDAMLQPAVATMPPTLDFEPIAPENTTWVVNPNAVQLPTAVTYTGVTQLSPYSFYSLLYPHAGSTALSMRGATYKLKNGMKFTTYGEYDADGNKVYNPSKLPWEKNNFNAAFELKSANGKFGIRLEVQRGRNYPY